MRQALSIAMLVTMLLGGCGQTPVAPPMVEDESPFPTYRNQMPGGFQAPMFNAAPTGTDPNAAPVIAQLAQAWSRVKTLSCHFDSWQTKGTERETGAFKVFFRKPFRYRYEVEKASSPIKNGSTAVFDTKTGDITARLGSVASIFPLKGKLSDERAVSLRGHRLDQGDYENLVKLLTAPGAQVRLASAPGAQPVLGLIKPFILTDELRLKIDPRTHLIGGIEHMYQGKIVSRSVITNLKVNPTLDPDKLEL
jgi:hypothetical protein